MTDKPENFVTNALTAMGFPEPKPAKKPDGRGNSALETAGEMIDADAIAGMVEVIGQCASDVVGAVVEGIGNAS